MSRPLLLVGGTRYLVDELSEQSLLPSHSDYVKQAIRFCLHWQLGQQRFEFHTSGSTGPPSLISFTREQLIASALRTQAALRLRSGDTALVCLDTRLIAGAMMLVRGMVTGMNMILQEPSSNPLTGIEQPIHFAAFVPYQVERMLVADSERLRSIQTILIGGAPLPLFVRQQLISFPNSIYGTYGMTETITHVALQKLSGPDHQAYFECLPGITVELDNRQCLVIHVPDLGTQAVITNDQAELISNQQFRWMGRIDRTINSGGIKIAAERVEEAIELVWAELTLTNRFFIAARPDATLGERVTLVVEGSLSAPEKVKELLLSRLSKYEVPKEILCTPYFVETPSQKVDRIKTLQKLSEK